MAEPPGPAPMRVTVYAGQGGGWGGLEKQPGSGAEGWSGGYDRATLLEGAQNALVAAPGELQSSHEAWATLRSGEEEEEERADFEEEDGGDNASELWEDNDADDAALNPGAELEEVDVQDNERVYLTNAYRDWECHYLRRLAKRIHSLACAELDRSEEALFMLFVNYDANLDGVVRGGEATLLKEAIEQALPGATSESKDGEGSKEMKRLLGRRKGGVIRFVDLLRWYSGDAGGHHKESSAGFSLTSFTMGLMGSGYVQNDARLEGLDWAGLRRNVVGYRRLLHQLREVRTNRALAPAREEESTNGLEAAMPLYYGVLAKEFEGDAEHLFELFSEVDDSNDMLLTNSEVEKLLTMLDHDASESDIRTYIDEINMSDGPLSFSCLVDWWDQARQEPASLVSTKGSGFIASVKANAYRQRVGSMFGGATAVQRRWAQAKEAGRLQALRQSYVRTFEEFREFKMERDLRALEKECAAL